MNTITQARLLDETLAAMEDNLRIPKANARDFLESLRAVIEEKLEGGHKVSVFGVVTLTPKGVPAKKKRKEIDRLTNEEVVRDAQPAKVRLGVSAAKRFKDVLPGPTTGPGKKLIAEAKERAAKAAERRAEREAQAEKDAKKAARAAKSGGKKSGAKKKGR